MKSDIQTREKLLEAAKKEFMDKGYMGASLRNICKEAGVTTGALYFFFKDKEDLFGSLVEEPLQQMQDHMNQHYEWEMKDFKQPVIEKHDFNEDDKVARGIVDYSFQHHDIFT